MTEKRILIYGDSNTWGDRGSGGGRYDHAAQWPNILQTLLGKGYEIIQEGLCGRIAGDHDIVDTHRNGHRGYEIAMRVASPVNLVIVALGTNDAKSKYGLSLQDIVGDLLWYDRRTREYADEHPHEMNSYRGILYIGAANFRRNETFDPPEGFSEELNKQLKDAGANVVILSDLEHAADGLHYSVKDHRQVAQMVYERVKEMDL